MYKVAVTGGIGSGKSKVCELLAMYGVAIYDSDSRAKQLMTSSDEIKRALVERFGDAVYVDGELNRSYLAERVFCDKQELASLNAIVHPAVMRDFDRWAEEQSGDYVILESAILFEAGLENRVDAVIAVMSPVELRLERAMRRDGASEAKIRERMSNQLTDDERCERSKYAIVNILLDDLIEDVEQLHRRLSYDARTHNA